MTEVVELIGIVPVLDQTDDDVQFRAWGSPKPVPRRQKYPAGSELTIVLVDGRDVGDLAEPGFYDWWFDRYFLEPLDEQVVNWLPASTKIRPRRNGHLDLALMNVSFTRRRLADDGLQLGEIREFRELLEKRLANEPVIRPAPVGSIMRPGNRQAEIDRLVDRGWIDPRSASRIVPPVTGVLSSGWLRHWRDHELLAQFRRDWTFWPPDSPTPFVVPRQEQMLAEVWITQCQWAGHVDEAAFWRDRKLHIYQHQDEWLNTIRAELPPEVWVLRDREPASGQSPIAQLIPLRKKPWWKRLAS